MKKLVFLFLSLLAIGGIFQACDNSKTYAEMLEDEKNAVEKFIKDSAIHVISLEQFERQDSTTDLSKNEYVAFTNGVYMQVVKRGDIATAEDVANSGNAGIKEGDLIKDAFVDNDEICVLYLEKDVATRDLTCFNVFLEEFADASQLYSNPAVFRYVNNATSYVAAGTFTEMDYYWASTYQSTAVPQGWLLALPYIYNNSHVRLIVPSKMGHSSAQQYVTPFYYDIRKFQKALS